MAERTIQTTVVLDGKEEFIQGMNEMTAALRRAEEAARNLNRALAALPGWLG